MTATLARLTLLVCLTCSAALGATMRLGALIPTPAHDSLLTLNPCSLPCLFGVTPGVNKHNEAMRLLEQSGISYSYYNPVDRSYPTHESTNPVALITYMYFGEPYMENVRALHLYQMSGTGDLGYLGDFLLANYRPAQVFAACQIRDYAFITLEDQDWFLQVMLDFPLTPTTPVTLVGATSGAEALAQSIHNFDCAAESDWTGFASRWKYLAVDS